MNNFVSIKEASNILGVSTQTLRRWEKQNKMPPPKRTKGGQRRYDITQLIVSNKIMTDFVSIKETKNNNQVDVAIPTDVNQLLEDLIEESYELIGKPVAVMTKEDKMKAIKYLESKGALLIKKSGDKISKFYDISKYSLYSYLNSDED